MYVHSSRFGFKRQGDCTTLYILNLALIDLLFCLVCSLQVSVEEFSVERGWDLGKTACLLVVFVRWALGWMDFLALALIAFSR